MAVYVRTFSTKIIGTSYKGIWNKSYWHQLIIHNCRTCSNSSEKPGTAVQDQKSKDERRKKLIEADEVYSPFQMYRPTTFEKKILVWTKYYPSMEEVPDVVMRSKMARSYDWMRIRVSIGMMIASIIIGLGYIYSGRTARQRGESLTERGKEWGRKLKEEAAREEVEAQAAAETAEK